MPYQARDRLGCVIALEAAAMSPGVLRPSPGTTHVERSPRGRTGRRAVSMVMPACSGTGPPCTEHSRHRGGATPARGAKACAAPRMSSVTATLELKAPGSTRIVKSCILGAV